MWDKTNSLVKRRFHVLHGAVILRGRSRIKRKGGGWIIHFSRAGARTWVWRQKRMLGDVQEKPG